MALKRAVNQDKAAGGRPSHVEEKDETTPLPRLVSLVVQGPASSRPRRYARRSERASSALHGRKYRQPLQLPEATIFPLRLGRA